jgi:hypothetical protein
MCDSRNRCDSVLEEVERIKLLLSVRLDPPLIYRLNDVLKCVLELGV